MVARKIVKKPVIERKTSLRGSSRCGFKRHSGNGKRGKIGSLSHSLSIRLIPVYGVVEHLDIALRWSAGIWTHRILSTCRSAGSRKLTPTRVECYLLKELFRRGIMGCYQVTLAQKIAKKPVIERKTSLRGSSRCGFKRHSGSGKRGKIGSLSHSLFTRLIPAYGVVEHLDIALRWSAGIWTHRILSTCRSAGSRKLTPIRVECYLRKELFRRGIMGCYQVTLARKIAKKPVIERKTSLRGASRCGFKRHSGNGTRGKIGSLSHSLFTRLIPAYGVVEHFDIALRWSAGIWTHRILSTCRSAGSRNLTPIRVECYLPKELFRRGIMGCYLTTN